MSLPPVVILAGGLGSRISSVTTAVPKAMIPVCGKPFLLWKLDELAKSGISKVYILTGHLSSSIESFVSQLRTKIEIQVIPDQAIGCGTAVALREALSKIQEDSFVLTYGDTLLSLEISKFVYPLSRGRFRMVATSWCGKADKRNVAIRGDFVEKYSKIESKKLTHVDYGYCYMNKAAMLELLTPNILDMGQFFEMLAINRRLEVFVTDEMYHEIGTPETLEDTSVYLESKA